MESKDNELMECLVSSAMARGKLDNRYAYSLTYLIYLLVKKCGGKARFTEAEAREFHASRQGVMLRAWKEGSQHTEVGWEVEVLSPEATQEQSAKDLLETLAQMADALSAAMGKQEQDDKEGGNLGRFDC